VSKSRNIKIIYGFLYKQAKIYLSFLLFLTMWHLNAVHAQGKDGHNTTDLIEKENNNVSDTEECHKLYVHKRSKY